MILNKLKFLFLAIFFLSNYSITFGQNFQLPEIPLYDSIYVDQYKEQIRNKSFFLQGKKVFQIGYNTNGLISSLFSTRGALGIDSCYNYIDDDNYDIYYLSKDQVTHHQFSETSNSFIHHQFDYNNQTIEKGEYYIVKELHNQWNAQNTRYKIGLWQNALTEKNTYKTIDYDQLLFDGQTFESIMTGEKKKILNLKAIADSTLKSIYGEAFFQNHIQFNFDKSHFITFPTPRPDQSSGYPLMNKTDQEILFTDLFYDLIIDKKRFPVIKFRISKTGEILGKTTFKKFVTGDFTLTEGLDKNNSKSFHPLLLNWQKTAKEEGFNIESKAFNLRFEWTYQEGIYGDLKFVIEEANNTKTAKGLYLRELKQLFINPWTGEKKNAKDKAGEATEE